MARRARYEVDLVGMLSDVDSDMDEPICPGSDDEFPYIPR